MGWTKDQEKAIYESGQNIIVSAGAGSGKTAVLSERILEKVKSGVSIDSLLVLTFTEAAAFEMKERIKKKVKDNPSTTHLASDVDSAYITTFDSYALSIVKKYHYLLGIDKNISVIDNSIIELFKINTLNSIFESLYEEKDALFLEFINKYCLKNDNQLKKEILNIDKKLDLKLNKEEFIYNYKNLYLNDKFYNSIYSDFEDYTFNLVNLSKLYYDEYIDVLEDKVYEKLWSECSPKDQAILYAMAITKSQKISDIRNVFNLSTNEFNPYRNRLIKKGLVNGKTRGTLSFTLPFFDQYVLEHYNL
jgi:superfamily I DNA/RNA helicase